MSPRVAFNEGPARDGKWHIGSDFVDPELAEMTANADGIPPCFEIV